MQLCTNCGQPMQGHPSACATPLPLQQNRTHQLKCWPQQYEGVVSGRKKCEVRRDDRGGFLVGDVLNLREWDPKQERFTGNETWVEVTHVLHGGQFGIEDGFAVLSIKPWGQ